MKRQIILLFCITGALIGMMLFKRMQQKNNTALYTIGILQTASHPALDAAREGFVEELNSLIQNKTGSADNVAYIIQNAQGSVTQAHAIAQRLHANPNLTGFFAIATPAAQAMSTVEKERPIVLAAVTDPHALGLVHATTNVCGVNDMINVVAQIDMLVTLIPHAKTIGLLYTTGEANSIALVKEMRLDLEKRGLNTMDFAVSNESDMHTAVELACRKVDLILAPTDNTVAATITVITSITKKYQKPFIVSDNMLVRYGALAARGVDYTASGKQAAHIAYRVFVDGEKPSTLPIESAENKTIVINKERLEALGLTVPAALQHDVVFVS